MSADLMFEFSCPSSYFDLSQSHNSNAEESSGNLDWFLQDHPLHEPIIRPQNDTNTTLKKKSAVLSNASAMRVSQPKRIESECHKNKSALITATKTAAVVSTFEKSSMKRSITTLETENSATQGIIQNQSNKRSNSSKTVEIAVDSKPMDMGSKLEEYRLKKAQTSVNGKNNIAPPSKSAVSVKNAKSKTDENKCMLEILKKHNEKFAVAPLYEPSRHSVRDVRKWEKQTGKIWANLSPEEREIVNRDISKQKVQQ